MGKKLACRFNRQLNPMPVPLIMHNEPLKPMRTISFLLLLGAVAGARFDSQAATAFPEPPGGWTYLYTGERAVVTEPGSGFTSLDETWDHTNGSDEWDGSAIGGVFEGGIGFGFNNSPGGVMALTQDGVDFLRIQSVGNPTHYDYPDPSNRKLYFGHDMSERGASETILDDGVTLIFRARVPTLAKAGGPLDPIHANNQSAAGPQPYPEGGDGYLVSDGGKGNFVIKQAAGGALAFALTVPDDRPSGDPAAARADFAGLTMNEFNGNQVTGSVNFGQGTFVGVPFDPTDWAEVWITIRQDPAEVGTHQAFIFVNGSLDPTVVSLTAGNGSDYTGISYLAIGGSATPQSFALDIDFVGYKLEAVFPPGALAEPFIAGISSSPSGVRIELADGLGAAATQVNPDTVSLRLNGEVVAVSVSKTDDVTTVLYTAPAFFEAGSTHEVSISFEDTGTPPTTHTFEQSFSIVQYATVQAEFRVPESSVDLSKPGFNVWMHQQNAPRPAPLNNLPNPLLQLHGKLIEPATGMPFENDIWTQYDEEAGKWEGFVFMEDGVINYNQDSRLQTAGAGSFTPDQPIPGIPGTWDSTDHIVMEATTILELKRGAYRMAVNSDDGFVVSSGFNAKDIFNVLDAPLGLFDGGRGAATTLFSFVVEEDGFYPFALHWWEGTGGASVEWWHEDLETGEAILINDRTNPNGIRAYREADVPPYVKWVTPFPNAGSVSVNTAVEFELGAGTRPIQTGAIQLLHNGQAVTPQISTEDGVTLVRYQPPTRLAGATTHEFTLQYGDTATPSNMRASVLSFSTERTLDEVDGFALVDDFNNSQLGDLNGQNGWFSNGGTVVVDPADPNNQVAGFIGGSGDRGSYINATIPDGAQGTLFFRLRVDTDNADLATPVLNWSVGMSDIELAGNGAFGDYQAQINQNRDAGNEFPEQVRSRNAGAFDTLADLLPEAWYNFWMAIDNAANTYQVYIQGGQFGSQTLLENPQGESTFVFRNATSRPDTDLIRIFIRLAGSHAGNLYLDDFWLDAENINLEDPSEGVVDDRIITSVVQRGGVEPVARSTGDVFDHPNVGPNFTVPFFGEDVPAFTDRVHQWNGATETLPLPSYLVGGEYVMLANNSRGSEDFELDITVSRPALVYVLIDNRHGDPASANTTPPDFTANTAWVLENWGPVTTGHNRANDPAQPDEVGVDEGATGEGAGMGINQFSSVYVRQVPAGTVTLFAPDNAGRNMYGVVVTDVTQVGEEVPVGIARVDNNVVISWPVAGSEDFILEATPTLAPANWTTVTTDVVVEGGSRTVTVPITDGTRYFRLRRP
jgi:hypothetical protein